MFEQKSIQALCMECKTDAKRGISQEEAKRRLQKDGRNELPEAAPKPLWAKFLEQLCDPLIYVLLAAVAVSLLLGEVSDTVIILFVVLMNAAIGLIQEGKAQKALDSLKRLSSPHAIVIRDGRQMQIPASELVMGDLVCLEAGCLIPADLRLTEAESLKIDESALTGEALPAEKNTAPLTPRSCADARQIPLGDRTNMAYMSTIVTYGRGQGIVTATGLQTQIGKIASLIQAAQEAPTPLQKRLGELGSMLSILSLLLCAALFLIGVLQHRNLFDMLITAISLAVAAVPEGLPAIVTICLALSVTRMVKVNTIIRRLPSVETLGAVSVVCSDKTGTLTQNKMYAVAAFCDGSLLPAEALSHNSHFDLLAGMTLCNDAAFESETGQGIGDPTELALLELSAMHGFCREALERSMPRIRELPFDSVRKMMTTLHRKGRQSVSYTKGAPDELLKRCRHILTQGKVSPLTPAATAGIRSAMQSMSKDALRVLALGMKQGEAGPLEDDLIFVGLIGMRDPARPEAAPAVHTCQQAGIRTVMITGDHIDTAYAIARELGIAQSRRQCISGGELAALSDEALKGQVDTLRVFARISPEQKMQIVRAFQSAGHIVAMTGDGVNDAPSLKAADVGVAMGQNGTDVARQAADVILTDDNFATIAGAVREGRGVYENIKKSVIFLLSSNLGEVLTMFLAVACSLAAPLKSSHILWINLITDSLPALALGIDQNDGNALMRMPPRKSGESLFAGGGLLCTCFYGILIAAISLCAFLAFPWMLLVKQGVTPSLSLLAGALGQGEVVARAQTYAFTVLGMSQLFHAVGMRSIHTSFFRMHHLENKLMLAAFVIGFFLQFTVTEVPFLIRAFGTVHLLPSEWSFLMLLSAFPLLAHELLLFTGWLLRPKEKD